MKQFRSKNHFATSILVTFIYVQVLIASFVPEFNIISKAPRSAMTDLVETRSMAPEKPDLMSVFWDERLQKTWRDLKRVQFATVQDNPNFPSFQSKARQATQELFHSYITLKLSLLDSSVDDKFKMAVQGLYFSQPLNFILRCFILIMKAHTEASLQQELAALETHIMQTVKSSHLGAPNTRWFFSNFMSLVMENFGRYTLWKIIDNKLGSRINDSIKKEFLPDPYGLHFVDCMDFIAQLRELLSSALVDYSFIKKATTTGAGKEVGIHTNHYRPIHYLFQSLPYLQRKDLLISKETSNTVSGLDESRAEVLKNVIRERAFLASEENLKVVTELENISEMQPEKDKVFTNRLTDFQEWSALYNKYPGRNQPQKKMLHRVQKIIELGLKLAKNNSNKSSETLFRKMVATFLGAMLKRNSNTEAVEKGMKNLVASYVCIAEMGIILHETIIRLSLSKQIKPDLDGSEFIRYLWDCMNWNYDTVFGESNMITGRATSIEEKLKFVFGGRYLDYLKWSRNYKDELERIELHLNSHQAHSGFQTQPMRSNHDRKKELWVPNSHEATVLLPQDYHHAASMRSILPYGLPIQNQESASPTSIKPHIMNSQGLPLRKTYWSKGHWEIARAAALNNQPPPRVYPSSGEPSEYGSTLDASSSQSNFYRSGYTLENDGSGSRSAQDMLNSFFAFNNVKPSGQVLPNRHHNIVDISKTEGMENKRNLARFTSSMKEEIKNEKTLSAHHEDLSNSQAYGNLGLSWYPPGHLSNYNPPKIKLEVSLGTEADQNEGVRTRSSRQDFFNAVKPSNVLEAYQGKRQSLIDARTPSKVFEAYQEHMAKNEDLLRLRLGTSPGVDKPFSSQESLRNPKEKSSGSKENSWEVNRKRKALGDLPEERQHMELLELRLGPSSVVDKPSTPQNS